MILLLFSVSLSFALSLVCFHSPGSFRIFLFSISNDSTVKKKSTKKWVVSSRIHNLMTNKITHDDRNDHITSYFFHFDAMISSLAIVMGLQRGQKQGPKNASTPKHTSRRGKAIQHDCSDNISHPTYWF